MNLIILLDEDFVSENKVKISGRRLEHILNIHKAEIGDALRVGKLNGKIGTGTIVNMNSEYIEMKIELTQDPPDPSNIQLILAMPRPKVFKRIIQDVTTMGIKKIYIIKTWRVEKSFWNSPVLEEEKLFEHMILGLEQAKDTILPQIDIVKLFKPFVEDEIPDIIKGTKAIVGHPIADIECPRNINSKVTLAIGPEGGFIDYEIEMLKKQGFEIVTLGNRILRVENAVPYIIGRLS